MNSLRHVKGLEHDETTVSAWNLFLALDELGDRKSAGAVLSNYLMWLLQREASSVSGVQRQIRRIVAQVTGRHVEG